MCVYIYNWFGFKLKKYYELKLSNCYVIADWQQNGVR